MTTLHASNTHGQKLSSYKELLQQLLHIWSNAEAHSSLLAREKKKKLQRFDIYHEIKICWLAKPGLIMVFHCHCTLRWSSPLPFF